MSSAFSKDSFLSKVHKLNSTQQSIQTLSYWMMYHRKRAKELVALWEKELYKGNSTQKLNLLYLANDVIQNSRRKGPEFIKEFGRRLTRVLAHVLTSSVDVGLKDKIERLINIWVERGVFSKGFIEELRRSLEQGVPEATSAGDAEYAPPAIEQELEPLTPPGSPSTEDTIREQVLNESSVPTTELHVKASVGTSKLERSLQSLSSLEAMEEALLKQIDKLPQTAFAAIMAHDPPPQDPSLSTPATDSPMSADMITGALRVLERRRENLEEEKQCREQIVRECEEAIARQQVLAVTTEDRIGECEAQLERAKQLQAHLVKKQKQRLERLKQLQILAGNTRPQPQA